jgi:hypothetical protein
MENMENMSPVDYCCSNQQKLPTGNGEPRTANWEP